MLLLLFLRTLCRRKTTWVITIFVPKHSVRQRPYICQTRHFVYNNTFTYYNMNAYTACTVFCIHLLMWLVSLYSNLIMESLQSISRCCNLVDKGINSCTTNKKTNNIKAMKLVVEHNSPSHGISQRKNSHNGYHAVSTCTLLCINHFLCQNWSEHKQATIKPSYFYFAN